MIHLSLRCQECGRAISVHASRPSTDDGVIVVLVPPCKCHQSPARQVAGFLYAGGDLPACLKGEGS